MNRLPAAKRAAERILIVDDSPPIREVFSAALDIAGYECHAVTSGEEAVALLKVKRFDLMICDLHNNPHGLVLLERVKAKLSRMQVIIATSPCCECTAGFAVNCMGASEYLLKPLDLKHLLFTVWRVLEGRKSSAGLELATA